MNKLVYSTLIIASTLAGANEVSAFGAGNLESKNPYGLNSAEKSILKNKKTLGNIDSKVKDVKYTLESINERIDGLESIYEGDSQKLNESVLKLNEIIKKVEENSTLTEKHSLDIENLKNVSSQILSMQEEFAQNIGSLKTAISKLSKKVNKIYTQLLTELYIYYAVSLLHTFHLW